MPIEIYIQQNLKDILANKEKINYIIQIYNSDKGKFMTSYSASFKSNYTPKPEDIYNIIDPIFIYSEIIYFSAF